MMGDTYKVNEKGGIEMGKKSKKEDKEVEVTYYYQKCDHVRQPFQIGSYPVLATGSLFGNEIYENPIPDLGVYLSEVSWSKHFSKPTFYGKITGFSSPNVTPPYPAIILDWQDQGGVSLNMLDWLVEGIITNIEAGKLVEVGCMGGHGRTGTLWACVLGKMENLSAHRAILELRDRYCEKAVESKTQAELIAYYLHSDPITAGNLIMDKFQSKVLYASGYGQFKDNIGNFGY